MLFITAKEGSMSDYERYVMKYASQRDITKAEAEKHALVKAVKAYYEEKEHSKDGE